MMNSFLNGQFIYFPLIHGYYTVFVVIEKSSIYMKNVFAKFTMANADLRKIS